MDRVLRFSDYEAFAYIASGLVGMAVWDLAFGTQWVLGAQWSVSEGVAVIFAAYIVGHIVASPAAWLLERRFVRRFLGAPSKVLFCEPPTGTLADTKRWLFPDYFTPLDRTTQERVKAKAAEEGRRKISGESLFWTAFARAKRDPSTYARMESFLKLYGFCRNIAFLGALAALLLIGETSWRAWHANSVAEIPDRIWWIAAALTAAVTMLYRYLKFHRLYSVEVFVGYAELPLLRNGMGVAAPEE